MNKKQKHTPGPWKHIPRERDGHADQIAHKGNVFVHVRVPFAEKPVLDYPHDNQQTANARLIAAAPELLEALKLALDKLEDARRYFPKSIQNVDKFALLNLIANTIKPAISKAEGVAE